MMRVPDQSVANLVSPLRLLTFELEYTSYLPNAPNIDVRYESIMLILLRRTIHYLNPITFRDVLARLGNTLLRSKVPLFK